jgi:cytidylate kinase
MSSNLQNLVERQMRNWDLARQQGELPPRSKPLDEIHPFVTIARQLGGGGLELARALGAKLDWQVYDRELLTYMADEDDVQRRLYALHDERHEGWLSSLMSALSPENPYRPDDYFHKLSRAVCTVARHESAVFVGRGAQFVLPSSRGVRVRVVAPSDKCAATVAQRDSIEIEVARKKIQEVDTQRKAFLRAHFVPDPLAAEHYDLVINTAFLSTAAAVEIILSALSHKTGHKD